jgi:hypothetical protein
MVFLFLICNPTDYETWNLETHLIIEGLLVDVIVVPFLIISIIYALKSLKINKKWLLKIVIIIDILMCLPTVLLILLLIYWTICNMLGW